MDPLPEAVKRFLEANIDSVDQLEILRVLGEGPEKAWSAASLAPEVQTSAETLGLHLAALHARGLLVTRTQGAELVCQYGTRTPELGEKLTALLRLYRERPVTMIKFVYARARDPLKTFADAFRLKKED